MVVYIANIIYQHTERSLNGDIGDLKSDRVKWRKLFYRTVRMRVTLLYLVSEDVSSHERRYADKTRN